MNRTEQRALRNIKRNAGQVGEDVTGLVECYDQAMTFIVERGLYADFATFQADEAEKKLSDAVASDRK